MIVLIYNNQILFDLTFEFPFSIELNPTKETLIHNDEIVIPISSGYLQALKTTKENIKFFCNAENAVEPLMFSFTKDIEEINIYFREDKTNNIIKQSLPLNTNIAYCKSTLALEVVFKSNLNIYNQNPNLSVKDVLLDIYSKNCYIPRLINPYIANISDLINLDISKIEKISLFDEVTVIEHTLEDLEILS